MLTWAGRAVTVEAGSVTVETLAGQEVVVAGGVIVIDMEVVDTLQVAPVVDIEGVWVTVSVAVAAPTVTVAVQLDCVATEVAEEVDKADVVVMACEADVLGKMQEHAELILDNFDSHLSRNLGRPVAVVTDVATKGVQNAEASEGEARRARKQLSAWLSWTSAVCQRMSADGMIIHHFSPLACVKSESRRTAPAKNDFILTIGNVQLRNSTPNVRLLPVLSVREEGKLPSPLYRAVSAFFSTRSGIYLGIII